MDEKYLLEIYYTLEKEFGKQNWWPGESSWEIVVGAILTQNVSWKNVEKCIENLKRSNCFEFEKMKENKTEKIAEMIVPSRYYNLKAKKLKAFIGYLADNHQGKLEDLFKMNLEGLRKELLSIWGIGEETADSIILYAAEKESFVVDAYTKRIFNRLGFFADNITYSEMRDFFMQKLPRDIKLYNDYHAQIVVLGNRYCKSKPSCIDCPLQIKGICPANRSK